MVKILMLGTYNIKNPFHGGQIRVTEIIKKYIDHNINAKYIAIFNKDSINPLESSQTDIGIHLLAHKSNMSLGLIGDLVTGQQAASDDNLFNKLTQLVLDEDPDFIQLEQPWLFPYYQKFSTKYPKIRLIYSSQNIEYKLKENILKEHYTNYSSIIKEIKDLEHDVCKRASLVIAVTEHEAIQLKEMGASKVIVSPNAYSIPQSPSKKKIAYWKEKINQDTFMIFVGSGHPPNTKGFMDLLGPAFGFLAPDQKIILCGGAGDSIYNYDHGIFKSLNLEHIENYGIVKNEDLTAILSLSTIVLLPIVETGGSNLKTAEAILSGKIVIATSIALRGYEEFKDEPYIIIANTPDDFKSAIKKCLRKDFSYTFSSDRTGEKYKKLLWNHSLENIPTTVLKLTKKQ